MVAGESSGKVDGSEEPPLQIVDGHLAAADFRPERPTRRLADLVGAATVKRSLTSMIERARAIHQSGPGPWLGGTLLYGPPSCGKTFAAEVVAGELGATLWHVDLDTSWHRQNLGGIIERALADRPTYGTVIYLNQVDNPHYSQQLQSKLALLDKAREHGKILILGAAVLPWRVDKAVARPGRLGTSLLVLPPDAPLRRTFIEQRLAGHAKATTEDLEWIVGRTDGHSFKDLEDLVNEVIAESPSGLVERSAWRLARRDSPPSCAEWLSTAGQHAMMSSAGGIYDDLLDYFAVRQAH